MKKAEMIRLASLCFPDNVSLDSHNVKSKKICGLWAGMGAIYRVDVPQKDSIIAMKHIKPPRHPTDMGDRRKADSYQVEANFYEQLVPTLGPNVNLPRTFHVEHLPQNEIIICMSYIESGRRRTFPHLESTENYNQAVLDWLASLHASYWGKEAVDEVVERAGLQPQGTYWHLDARPEEHAKMSDKGWEGRLKLAARAIDLRLREDKCQCLIHGDAKDANVILSEQGEIVMCDFQYCGKGSPAKDLAYFLCTEVEGDPIKERAYLQYYLQQLQFHLNKYIHDNPTPNNNIPSLDELQESLDLAYCDFCRFMCGWGFWGGDLSSKVIPVLNRLDGGTNLGSEEAYIEAMEREYGV